MIIAFCGPSGSGKTTLLNDALESSVFRGYDCNVNNEDNFLILRIAKRVLGNKKFIDYNKSKMSNYGKNIASNKFSSMTPIIYPLIVYSEYLFLFIYYKKIFNKKVLFADRWAFDYLITFKENLAINNKLINLLFRNFPRPDLVFYLQIDANTALLRNKSGSRFSKTNELQFQKSIVVSYDELFREINNITISTITERNKARNQIITSLKDKILLSRLSEIAIIGVDGTGKSTITNLINNYSESLGEKSRVVHFYHNNMLLKIINRLSGSSVKSSSDFKRTRDRNIKKINRHPAVKIFFATLHFTDSHLQYLIFRIMNRNSILIFDRFFSDYIISFSYYRIPKIDIFDRFARRIKNEFVILVDSRIAYDRKPEANLDFYEFSNLHYKKYAKKHNMKIIKSGTKTPEEIVKQIFKQIEV